MGSYSSHNVFRASAITSLVAQSFGKCLDIIIPCLQRVVAWPDASSGKLSRVRQKPPCQGTWFPDRSRSSAIFDRGRNAETARMRALFACPQRPPAAIEREALNGIARFAPRWSREKRFGTEIRSASGAERCRHNASNAIVDHWIIDRTGLRGVRVFRAAKGTNWLRSMRLKSAARVYLRWPTKEVCYSNTSAKPPPASPSLPLSHPSAEHAAYIT